MAAFPEGQVLEAEVVDLRRQQLYHFPVLGTVRTVHFDGNYLIYLPEDLGP